MPDASVAAAVRSTQIGERHGLLVIVDWIRIGRRFSAICRCDCGGDKVVKYWNLQKSVVRSCGCLIGANLRSHTGKHGAANHGTKTAEYIAWTRMRQVCLNPKHPKFAIYGARGISICQRWDLFENFLEDMGVRPARNLSIDRINVDGNYEPSNCRWATPKQQSRNQRRTKLTESIAAEIRCLASSGIKQIEIARRLGVSADSVSGVARGKTWLEENA